MKPHLEEICFLGLRSQSHELENRGEKGVDVAGFVPQGTDNKHFSTMSQKHQGKDLSSFPLKDIPCGKLS